MEEAAHPNGIGVPSEVIRSKEDHVWGGINRLVPHNTKRPQKVEGGCRENRKEKDCNFRH